MNTDTRNSKKFVLFRQLSIQQRLPLFICLLLLAVVVAFGTISYLSVRKAAIAVGSERATTLADKLSSIFKTSVDAIAKQANTVATDSSIKSFLIKRDKADSLGAMQVIQKFLEKDTTNKLVQLMDAGQRIILTSGGKVASLKANIDSLRSPSSGKPGYLSVGKMTVLNGLMYYPALAPVMQNDKIGGYVVSWKIFHATKQSIDQLAQLLGANGTLYFGNDDQQFWTDMIKPVSKPPVALDRLKGIAQYSRGHGPIIASMRKIPDSRWLILIELSGTSFNETASIFLRWVIIIGVILIIGGSAGGWLMSRNITRPLNQLSTAAVSIADGDYQTPVEIDRDDELGKLAVSFNVMAARVHAAQLELEQKIEDRTRELETAITDIEGQKESDRRKDEFISIASHELRAPLTALKAFLQLAALEMPQGLKSYNFIGNASRQLNRMERLIADLLDVSIMSSGKMRYNFEEFDFDKLLRTTMESIQQTAPEHQLILERITPARLKGDRHRLEQVIVNLVNNAVKYSPEAEKVIIWSDIKDDKLRVTVKDFGIGISKKNMEGLFDRFYRVEGSKYRFEGLGLGLFISCEIVKSHNGQIWVESEPGKGSEFSFELPLV